jgi:hypothetical protein
MARLQAGRPTTFFYPCGHPTYIYSYLPFFPPPVLSQIVPCSVCLHFNATDETMTSRLLRRGKTSGRADDDATTIRERLEVRHRRMGVWQGVARTPYSFTRVHHALPFYSLQAGGRQAIFYPLGHSTPYAYEAGING